MRRRVVAVGTQLRLGQQVPLTPGFPTPFRRRPPFLTSPFPPFPPLPLSVFPPTSIACRGLAEHGTGHVSATQRRNPQRGGLREHIQDGAARAHGACTRFARVRVCARAQRVGPDSGCGMSGLTHDGAKVSGMRGQAVDTMGPRVEGVDARAGRAFRRVIGNTEGAWLYTDICCIDMLSARRLLSYNA